MKLTLAIVLVLAAVAMAQEAKPSEVEQLEPAQEQVRRDKRGFLAAPYVAAPYVAAPLAYAHAPVAYAAAAPVAYAAPYKAIAAPAFAPYTFLG